MEERLRQIGLLQSYLDNFGEAHETALQQDMIAKYLECTRGAEEGTNFSPCLEKLMCLFYDKKTKMSQTEREVTSV